MKTLPMQDPDGRLRKHVAAMIRAKAKLVADGRKLNDHDRQTDLEGEQAAYPSRHA